MYIEVVTRTLFQHFPKSKPTQYYSIKIPRLDFIKERYKTTILSKKETIHPHTDRQFFSRRVCGCRDTTCRGRQKKIEISRFSIRLPKLVSNWVIMVYNGTKRSYEHTHSNYGSIKQKWKISMFDNSFCALPRAQVIMLCIMHQTTVYKKKVQLEKLLGMIFYPVISVWKKKYTGSKHATIYPVLLFFFFFSPRKKKMKCTLYPLAYIIVYFFRLIPRKKKISTHMGDSIRGCDSNWGVTLF